MLSQRSTRLALVAGAALLVVAPAFGIGRLTRGDDASAGKGPSGAGTPVALPEVSGGGKVPSLERDKQATPSGASPPPSRPPDSPAGPSGSRSPATPPSPSTGSGNRSSSGSPRRAPSTDSGISEGGGGVD